ncbi:hypothetical protein ACFUT3_30380 [Streptomyces cinereoruber]|uniref:hypothetical protein n=1 Tax=Streptomyces cinereoruber TaxID=67260 RepID=UPI00362B4D5D
MLLKTGTPVYAARAGSGCVGTVKRVLPHLGMYWIETAGSDVWPVKISEFTVRAYPVR